MRDPLTCLTEQGVSIWLDHLSRKSLVSGDLDTHIASGVVGVTTNPSIFREAMRDATTYEQQLREFAHLGVGATEAVRMLACGDVRTACDALRLVYESSGGAEGRVSIEVDPRWAHDTERTLADARSLWWLVDRPNAMIKIPATPAGLAAVTACLAEGISVNVTLIFSLQRYREVIDAFLAGMERARINGLDLAAISSVASFFVSRVDTEVDRQLDALGTRAARTLRGHAAIANARLAYEAYENSLRDARWMGLASVGAHPQRPLWASTGVKDPEYEDTRYVIELVAPGTVNTVPEKTLAAVIDHGEVHGDRIRAHYSEARSVFAGLTTLGIDMSEVLTRLEQEGIASFQDAWQTMLADVSKVLDERARA